MYGKVTEYDGISNIYHAFLYVLPTEAKVVYSYGEHADIFFWLSNVSQKMGAYFGSELLDMKTSPF